MKTLYILLLSLCWLNPVAAIDFGGIAWADYYGLIDDSTWYTNERLRFTVAPEFKWKSESGLWDAHLSGVAYVQFLEDDEFLCPPAIIDQERIIREAYVSLHLGIVDIDLGQKFVTWGMVDYLSPLNVVNHSDTTVLSVDNILEGSLPDVLAQVRIYPTDSLSIELIYAPFLQPNLFDIEDIEIIVENFPFLGSNYHINAAFKDRGIPLFSEWAHSLYSAVHYSSYLVDLIVSYSTYLDKNPDFDLSGITETIMEPDHTITGTAYPTYTRVHNIGAGVSFYLGNFLVSADSAIKVTKDWEGSAIEIHNSELFSALQVERLFWNRVRAHLNVYHRYVFNYDTPIETPYSPLIENYIIAVIDDYLLQKPQSQVYFLGHLDSHFLREKLMLGVNFVYGYTEKGYYLVPRITYKISDRVTVSAGADIWVRGDFESFLGRNESRDNFFLRFQYAW
jgi:hypothetical protein